MSNVLVERKGAAGWITFNDPAKHNAMSLDMWAAIKPALESFAADDDIKVVVITGAGGKAFVSGANISQFDKLRTSADAVAEYERIGEGAQQALYDFPKPTIARIQGYCIGGGMSIALCCDIRIASESSSFSLPAGKMGLGYRFTAIRNLVTVVGAANALDIFLSARRFKADEAKGMGLAHFVKPDAEFDAFVEDYVAMIAANAPLTLRTGKTMIREFQKLPADSDIEKMRQLVMNCFSSEDYQEGKRAFAEKRSPQFKGR